MNLKFIIYYFALFIGAYAYADDKANLLFYQGHGHQKEIIRLNHWQGKPLLLSFWRSDCRACVQEIQIFPRIATENNQLEMVLISLYDEKKLASYIKKLPKNVHVVTAYDAPEKVLSAFENRQFLGLPYSVMLTETGEICKKHYGIISPDKVKEWHKQCSEK